MRLKRCTALDDYARDAGVTDSLSGAMSEHLRRCESCRRRWEGIRHAYGVVDGSVARPLVPPSPRASLDVMSRLRQEDVPRRRKQTSIARPLAVLFAAVLIVSAGGAGLRWRGFGKSKEAKFVNPSRPTAVGEIGYIPRSGDVTERRPSPRPEGHVPGDGPHPGASRHPSPNSGGGDLGWESSDPADHGRSIGMRPVASIPGERIRGRELSDPTLTDRNGRVSTSDPLPQNWGRGGLQAGVRADLLPHPRS